jgi:2-oxo-3-hexenedioate decarboxylase
MSAHESDGGGRVSRETAVNEGEPVRGEGTGGERSGAPGADRTAAEARVGDARGAGSPGADRGAHAGVDVEGLARTLDDAARTATLTAQLGDRLALADAYRVQARSIGLRHARGERRAGYKLGFTSRAKMAQMGLHEVIWGRLTDAMIVADGGEAAAERFIHPRVEPEVCFLMGAPLAGTVTSLAAMRALAGVAPALEVIDSRYRDFKFSLADVVADNCSAAAIVVGPWSDPATVDVANLGLLLEIDGAAAQIGSSAAILGHPVRSLVAAARLVAEAGERLEPGDLVMAGGATEAVALNPGSRVRLEAERLGSVGFKLGERREAVEA